MNRASLDTNILLRLLLDDIPGRAEAIVNYIADSGMTFKIPDLAITEAVYVMSGGSAQFSREKIRGLFWFVFDYPNYEFPKEFFNKVFDLYVKHPKLSFNDCYLAYKVEEEKRLPLYTLDKKLAKQVEIAELLPIEAK